MSSQGARSGSHCCTNRDPPSPDGGPPRPTVSSTKDSQSTDQDRLSSYSTEEAEAAILRSIFEEDKAKSLGTTIPFKRSSVYKLASLFVADKSDVSDEEPHRDIEEKRSSTTLNSVTQKLKKHLPLEFALVKRRSRSSVGTAEEVGRRAELRRIRNQRIQEELSNETTYDDDAKSLSRISDAETSLGKGTQSSMRAWAPSDAAPLPPLLTRALVDQTSTFDELPSSNRQSGLLVAVEGAGEDNSRAPEPQSSLSSAESDGEGTRLDFQTPFYSHTRELSAITPIPAAPILQPKRLPSITVPPKSSWRLSFASSNRGEVLRNLSLVHDSTDAVNLEQWNADPQALRTWFHNRSVRSSSSAIISSEDKAHYESLACRSQTCTDGQGPGDVDDRVEYDPSTVRLHEMRISQRLGSSGPRNSCSSPHMSTSGSHRRRVSSNSNGSRNGRADDLWNTSDCVSLTDEIAQLWDQIMEERPTQSYSPASNRTQTDMETSYSNTVPPLNETHSKDEIDSVRAETALVSPTTPSNHSPSPQVPFSSPLRRSTVDNSSVLVSEIESFREREAELNVIKSRFLFREAKKGSSAPASTKFKEEFHLNLQPPKSWTAHAPSILVRLSKLVSRYHDGRATTEESMAIPTVPTDLVQTTTCGSEPGKPGGGAWAFKSKYNPINNARKRTEDCEEFSGKSVLGGLSHMAWAKKKRGGKTDLNEPKNIVEEPNKHSDECTSIEELAINIWAQKALTTEAALKSDKEKVVKKRKGPGPDLKFPAAWASYPSRSRRARNRSDGWPDSIHVRDFALKTSINEVSPFNEHGSSGSVTLLGEGTRNTTVDGVMGKQEQSLKSEVNRLETTMNHSHIDNVLYGRANPSWVELDYRQLPRLERLLMDALPMKRTTAAKIAKSILVELAEQTRGGSSLVEQRKVDEVLQETRIKGVNESPILQRGETPLQQLSINIGDPTFYEDCIVGSNTKNIMRKSSEREDFTTGSGNDTEKHKYGSSRGRKSISLGSTALRKSTDEYHSKLELMEKAERVRVLQAVEEAWG